MSVCGLPVNAPHEAALLAAAAAAAIAALNSHLATADPAQGANPALACDAARSACALAAELGRPHEQARAAAWLCTHLMRLGRHADVLHEAPRALPLMASHGVFAERCELLRVLTLCGSELAAFDVALDAAHELVRITAGSGPQGADGPALTAALALAVCFERMGDSWQAVRLLSQALQDHGQAASVAVSAPVTAPATAPVTAPVSEPHSLPLLPLLMATNALCATAIGILHRLLDADDNAEVQDVLQRARQAGEQAHALLARVPDLVYEVTVLGNLGEVMLYQGQAQAAEPLLRQAHRLALERGLMAHAWRVQASLGAWLMATSVPAEALKAMRLLIAEMGPTAPQQSHIRAHHVAYRACRALGLFDQALMHFEVAERTERRRAMAQLRAQSQLFVTRTEAQQAQWQAEQARLEAQAQRARAAEAAAHAELDPLTGLGNRRHLHTRCADLLPAARLRGRPLALAQVDIDRFKQINDQHGHAAGDQVLVLLAQLLCENMRADDVLVRHGGEEFVLVLPGLALDGATEVCERLRERVAAYRWQTPGGKAFQITISIGLAAAPSFELPMLLQRADEALYAAKRGGRNRLCLAPAFAPA